ncbi:MAG: hypothetical protein L0Y71_15305 [Gemmataceae bacterium]|nr:hypothetical protein [Gemmataceae bacterium]
MKSLSGGVLLLACLGLTAILFAQPGPVQDSAERRAASEQRQAERYEINRARRDAFAQFAEDVCRDIESGKLRLAEASQRVLNYSKLFYPEYLANLPLAERGATDRERIARNFLRHFTNVARTRPEQANPALISRLEGELTALMEGQ